MPNKRSREAASSTEDSTGDESSDVPAPSITLEVFSAGTLRHYQEMCKHEPLNVPPRSRRT